MKNQDLYRQADLEALRMKGRELIEVIKQLEVNDPKKELAAKREELQTVEARIKAYYERGGS